MYNSKGRLNQRNVQHPDWPCRHSSTLSTRQGAMCGVATFKENDQKIKKNKFIRTASRSHSHGMNSLHFSKISQRWRLQSVASFG